MKRYIVALAAALVACSPPPDSATDSRATANVSPADQTMTCNDSLPRADGTQRTGAPCNVSREYCFEASGGAAISHGAQCRPLPTSDATCADLIAALGAGASCTGTQTTGIRVAFAFP